MVEQTGFNLHSVPETLTKEKYSDIVIIRPPYGITPAKINELSEKLDEEGFLVVTLPHRGDDDQRWWPTDRFREIGDIIFENGNENELENTLAFLQATIGSSFNPAPIQRRIIKVNSSVVGGFYTYLLSHKIFMYCIPDSSIPIRQSDRSKTYRLSMKQKKEEEIRQNLNLLQDNGWHLYEFSKEKRLLPRSHSGGRFQTIEEDFDGLNSLYLGKDGKPHAIVAKSFTEELQDITNNILSIHPIPDEEAGEGHGCNIADLRNGSVLIPPNSQDAPTTFRILTETAAAQIIEAPQGFFDYVSGPRCNITSLSIN